MKRDKANIPSMNSMALLIGRRIALARGDSVSQEQLAQALGFKDRQTISAIEVGERKVSSDELIAVADCLGKSVDYFTDPYLVPEKAEFSYRASTLDISVLLPLESQAERLISAQRRFRVLLGDTGSPVHSQLPDVTKSTPLAAATLRGEQTAAAWKLGDRPALRLREVAEERLGVSVFYVDAPDAISGAACYLDDGSVILINRREAFGRQNFNLGHEIFHLLTWREMPPERLDLELDSSRPRPRVEQMADAFAEGLLMPASIVQDRWERKGEASLALWLHQHAAELGVSRKALHVRLAHLGLIGRNENFPSRPAGVRTFPVEPPRLYNQEFVTRLQAVLARGHLTVMRAIKILDCTIEELTALLRSYELNVPFDL